MVTTGAASEAGNGHETELAETCRDCPRTAQLSRRRNASMTCACGRVYTTRRASDALRLSELLADADAIAKHAGYLEGRAVDLQRSRRPVASDNRTAEERERDDVAAQAQLRRAVALHARLNRLREHARECGRALAVVEFLVTRCGSERWKNGSVRVGGVRLQAVVGRAFASEEHRGRTDKGAQALFELHGTALLREAADLWAESE